MMSFRYSIGRRLSEAFRRQTVQGKDSWTGVDVILKSGEFDSILREAQCLLSLPPGVSAGIVEPIWKGAGDLTLVLEQIGGRTLREAATGLRSDQIPTLGHALAQVLAHVHRVGWIHADIKPDNIMVQRDGDAIVPRLIDFGFAIDVHGGTPVDERGGTPMYIAPEVRKGWIVDGRADVYSLGIVLRELLLERDPDPLWAPILEKACQEAPAKRHASAAELRDEIGAAFGIEPGIDRIPSFGVGAMRGRQQATAAVRVALDGKSCLLVQARPGTGLSRFLKESVLAVAAVDGPPVRAIDLGAVRTREGIDRILDFLESSDGCPMSMLCGIGDPSPGLRWTDEETRSRLHAILSRPGWKPYDLTPLDIESFREMVISSLGANDPLAAGIAGSLREKTEADLVRSSLGFRHCIEAAGSELGGKWKLDTGKAQEALASWKPAPAPPFLESIPEDFARALAACARLGRSFPSELCGPLLERFGAGVTPVALTDHGYLTLQETDRTAFVTHELWKDASELGSTDEDAIDRWILDHFDPSVDQVEDVIQVSLLERRKGNAARESTLLADALTRARSQTRNPDVLRILAYPGAPPAVWTLQSVLEHVEILQTILGSGWSKDALLGAAGQAVRSVNAPLGIEISERAAASADPTAALPALRMLAERAAELAGHPRYREYIEALRAWEGRPGGPPPGCIEYIEALHGFANGKSEDAERHARVATEKLRGSGDRYEAMSAQMIAVVQFEHDPERGIASMITALEAVRDLKLEALIRRNLALMYDRMGLPDRGFETTDLALRRCEGLIDASTIANMRVQRCLELNRLDRIDEAREEILAMLSLPSNQFVPVRLVILRSELANGHLHRGNEREALRHIVQAAADALARGAPVHLAWGPSGIWWISWSTWEIRSSCANTSSLYERVPTRTRRA